GEQPLNFSRSNLLSESFAAATTAAAAAKPFLDDVRSADSKEMQLKRFLCIFPLREGLLFSGVLDIFVAVICILMFTMELCRVINAAFGMAVMANFYTILGCIALIHGILHKIKIGAAHA
uniref:Uncharacterized protein n=1 Tax=Lutzomyia longipalpis TaxID=7200 RepID=A0A1B0CT25_LUTLO